MSRLISTEVTGIPETVSALKKIGDLDYSKAEHEAGKVVLAQVRLNTRHDTGTLQGAWNVDGGAFVNEEDYASFQEFGTRFVSPSHAVDKAWNEKQSAVEKVFEKEIEHAASQAGLDS